MIRSSPKGQKVLAVRILALATPALHRSFLTSSVACRDQDAKSLPARDWSVYRPPKPSGDGPAFGSSSSSGPRKGNRDTGSRYDRPPRDQNRNRESPFGLPRNDDGQGRRDWQLRTQRKGQYNREPQATSIDQSEVRSENKWLPREQITNRRGLQQPGDVPHQQLPSRRGLQQSGNTLRSPPMLSRPTADAALRPAYVKEERTAELPADINRGKYSKDDATSSSVLDAELPMGSDEGDSRHGRQRHPRDTRSLLHTPEGDFTLPGARHRSKDKGKLRDDSRMRDRDWSQRAWVVEQQDDSASAARAAQKKEMDLKRAKRSAVKHAKDSVTTKRTVDVFIPASISVAQLSEKFGVKLARLQRKMMQLGMDEEQRRPGYLLNSEEALNVAIEFDLNPVIDEDLAFDIYPESDADNSVFPLRPPVVTIMGHVDHGKTTLLDSLRHTSVAAGEAGGITQHIGAFSVPLASLLPPSAPPTDATITFLDTPGHAAFTGMRARGASVTDLVVLVVAADDGVMPQTKEVIELVKKEGEKVGLVVAINKCDKPTIDIERVKSALGAEGILLEEDGGDVPAVRVSGLAKTGLDDLVETLSTLAEIRDLRASREGKAEGYVLESRVDKGRGNVATVLVTRGTLKSGASIVAGTTWCRVRQMTDSTGRAVRETTPGMPVSITGWKDLPSAGDQLLEAISGENEAKKCVTNRLSDIARRKLSADLEQINNRRIEERLRAQREAEELEAVKDSGGNVTQAMHAVRKAEERNKGSGFRELLLVIKGDVSGTVEAVVGSLQGIGNKEAGVKIIHTGVGDVTESDISLAAASEATVIGFSVACPRSMQTLAASSSVPILIDSVIYRLIEGVRSRVAALLPPVIEHRITGEATVQQLFEIKLSRKEHKVIAGCRVNNGTINRAEGVRVLRGPDRDIVYEGTIDTLKHMKKDVTDVRKGTECGIGLHEFADVREGDEIVSFQTFDKPREL